MSRIKKTKPVIDFTQVVDLEQPLETSLQPIVEVKSDPRVSVKGTPPKINSHMPTLQQFIKTKKQITPDPKLPYVDALIVQNNITVFLRKVNHFKSMHNIITIKEAEELYFEFTGFKEKATGCDACATTLFNRLKQISESYYE